MLQAEEAERESEEAQLRLKAQDARATLTKKRIFHKSLLRNSRRLLLIGLNYVMHGIDLIIFQAEDAERESEEAQLRLKAQDARAAAELRCTLRTSRELLLQSSTGIEHVKTSMSNRFKGRVAARCRANMAHTRQSSPESGLGLQVNFSSCSLFTQ